MKLEEINLKFEKVQDIMKFKKVHKVQKTFEIHIQSQMLLEDTQYFQYRNTVELHALHF